MREKAASQLLRSVELWRPQVAPLFYRLLVHLSDPAALDPVVVEHQGCLLKRQAVENAHLDEWFEERFNDSQREYVLNHIHLWDVVSMPDDDAQANALTERLRELLPILADYWRWSLARQVNKPIDVWIADDPEEYGPTIGFGYVR